MKDFSNIIRAYSLKNAIDFGKADASKILPKLFQHGLEKQEIRLIIPEISKIVKEVNSLSKEKQLTIFPNYESIVKTHEEKEKTLPELPNIEKIKKPVLRVAPFPSGALHLGNAKTFILNALYAEKYNGKLLLVMDDTIGSVEKPINEESYNLIEEAFNWLGIKYEKKIIYKSDRLKTYYDYAKKLIKKNKAYVCHCDIEELRKNRAEGKECGCRQFPAKIQLQRWKEMFNAEEGSATLRIKTDMMHPNPAFRDRVLFKISDRKHPRIGNKYRVWPTLEMSWAIDDHLLGITHIIRGNDLFIESEMEKYLWDIFSWKYPEIIHTGLVNIEGVKISKSKAQKEVQSGKYFGWHDPRTWSIQSLKKRGLSAEAIREFVKEIGLNKQNITIPIEALYSINRSIIDKKSNRYSFIENPIKLDIENPPALKTIDVPLHPEKPETRKIIIDDVYISKEDYDKFKQKEIRLLHLYNIKLGKKIEFTSIENKDIPKINWISHYVSAKILMPDGTFKQGIADAGIRNLSPKTTIQFERFGFARFNAKLKENNNDIYEFWFAHK